MCSIVGIFRFNGTKQKYDDTAMLSDALSIMARRGPDESAIIGVAPGVTMGGNRLAIRCPVGAGSMPFFDDGCVCFYNGEIYNFANWVKNAESDGLSIIPAYREKDIMCFAEFDGEFAISLWDDKSGELILARDVFGTKPVYFSIEDGSLFWASSEMAVANMTRHNSFCCRTKSPTYQHSYTIQEPYTSFDGVWSIPPGHCLVASDRKLEMRPYNCRINPFPGCTFSDLTEALTNSLESRLSHSSVIGIPMSGGVDSGIIAFTADRLAIDYEVFSVIRMFKKETPETEAILRRTDRLRNCKAVHLLSCNEGEYADALSTMYRNGYYSSERFDSGAIGLFVVLKAMAARGVRVAIDGTGGDELFHGYKFRNDFECPEGWPSKWEHSPGFYSLWTTLLDYTSKVDQAGAYWSIETRFPFQTIDILRCALALPPRSELKWPLRKFLADCCSYGPLSSIDKREKYGFSLKHRLMDDVVAEMEQAWMDARGLQSLPNTRPTKFPFTIGVVSDFCTE
jgi:asparagine synthase (glutamine-hydrolysing)